MLVLDITVVVVVVAEDRSDGGDGGYGSIEDGDCDGGGDGS